MHSRKAPTKNTAEGAAPLQINFGDQGSALAVQGAQVQSLVRELDPTCCS